MLQIVASCLQAAELGLIYSTDIIHEDRNIFIVQTTGITKWWFLTLRVKSSSVCGFIYLFSWGPML